MLGPKIPDQNGEDDDDRLPYINMYLFKYCGMTSSQIEKGDHAQLVDDEYGGYSDEYSYQFVFYL